MRAQVRNLEKEKLIKSQMVATQSSRSREVKHRVKPSHSRCRTLQWPPSRAPLPHAVPHRHGIVYCATVPRLCAQLEEQKVKREDMAAEHMRTLAIMGCDLSTRQKTAGSTDPHVCRAARCLVIAKT